MDNLDYNILKSCGKTAIGNNFQLLFKDKQYNLFNSTDANLRINTPYVYYDKEWRFYCGIMGNILLALANYLPMAKISSNPVNLMSPTGFQNLSMTLVNNNSDFSAMISALTSQTF